MGALFPFLLAFLVFSYMWLFSIATMYYSDAQLYLFSSRSWPRAESSAWSY